MGRAIVDGALLRRFGELGMARRVEVAGRAGYHGHGGGGGGGGGAGVVGEVRAELEGVLGWAGLGYF